MNRLVALAALVCGFTALLALVAAGTRSPSDSELRRSVLEAVNATPASFGRWSVVRTQEATGSVDVFVDGAGRLAWKTADWNTFLRGFDSRYMQEIGQTQTKQGPGPSGVVDRPRDALDDLIDDFMARVHAETDALGCVACDIPDDVLDAWLEELWLEYLGLGGADGVVDDGDGATDGGGRERYDDDDDDDGGGPAMDPPRLQLEDPDVPKDESKEDILSELPPRRSIDLGDGYSPPEETTGETPGQQPAAAGEGESILDEIEEMDRAEQLQKWEQERQRLEQNVERARQALENQPKEEYYDDPEHQRIPGAQDGSDVMEREAQWRASRLRWLRTWLGVEESLLRKHLEKRPGGQPQPTPGGVRRTPVSDARPGESRVLDPTLDPVALGGPSGRGGATSPLEVVVVSTGGSTGPVMDMYLVNHGKPPVQVSGEGIVLEPVTTLDAGARQRIEDIKEAASSGKPLPPRSTAGVGAGPAPVLDWLAPRVVKVPMDAYCLQLALDAPAAGQVFRLADREAQAAHAAARSILMASRRLRKEGRLHPDSEPEAYFHSARQWAIWAHEQGFDRAGFEKALLAHTRKNLEAAGQRWSKEAEQAVRGLVPNRWADVSAILEAAGLGA